jgi:hypothetical protein
VCQELNLRQNCIGDPGAKALAAAIAAPSCQLRVCDVQNNLYGVLGKNALNEAYKSTQGRVCVYYCRTYYKAVRGGGEEESGGHVLGSIGHYFLYSK